MFIPIGTAFDAQRFFLEPVTETSINSDPLTLFVPVNRTKPDRL